MSANVYDDRMITRGQPAWHNFVREVYDPVEKVSAEEAIVRSGNDFEFRHVPMHIVLGGKRITVEDKVALVRMPHDDKGSKVMAVVHPNYPVFQNLELGKLLKPLSDKWPVESCGSLGEGEQIFLCFNAGEAYVKGLDPIRQYVTMSDFRDGARAFEMFNTDVRTVCENTFNAGIEDSVGRVSIGHAHGTFKADVGYWTQVMGRLARAQANRLAYYDRMASELIPDDAYVDALLSHVYPLRPMPQKVALVDKIIGAGSEVGYDGDVDELIEKVAPERKRWEYDNELVIARREAIKGPVFATSNEETPAPLRGTKWVLFNAVTRYENYRDGRGSSQGDIGQAIMFGSRGEAMGKAFRALTNQDRKFADLVAVN
jgi:hypothetical protein